MVAVATGEMGHVSLREWVGVFSKGLWFDLAAAAYLMVPVLLYEAILPDAWRVTRWHHCLRLLWLWCVSAGLFFGTAAELLFWNEFSTRFNFIAIDYLVYTHEVVGNIIESHPTVPILAVVGILALSLVVGLRKRVSRHDAVPLRYAQRWAYFGSALCLPAVSLVAVDLDQMAGSGNAYLDQLSGNGVYSLAAAFRRNDLDYDRFYATIPEQEAHEALVRARNTPVAPLQAIGARSSGTSESEKPPQKPRRPKHVVLVSIESLSAHFLGAFGSGQGLTPNLDRLASEGLLFTDMYATGTRTVRGLEALSVGLPPLPGQSIVRRPDSDNLVTIGAILKRRGFHTSFVYGGYSYFDNMRAYFGGNRYQVMDRTDFPGTSIAFENIWGVADESLFGNALLELDRQIGAGHPVFMHVMTTSNHRPYTYPQGRIDIPSPGGRDGAVKYTDYAIGQFVAEASRRPWFAETLFVFIADHCASVAGKTKLPVQNYHIPLILYAPALVAPGRDARVASQIDVVPTVLDVLAIEPDIEFLGTSLFQPGSGEQRAFLSNYQEVGYYKSGVLTVLSPKKRVEAFTVDTSTWTMTPRPVERMLASEAIAYYQTAARILKGGGLKYHAQPGGGREAQPRSAGTL